jgi:hypothetical protein
MVFDASRFRFVWACDACAGELVAEVFFDCVFAVVALVVPLSWELVLEWLPFANAGETTSAKARNAAAAISSVHTDPGTM